ncbi:MAG TPA: recombinase family protein [Vicinamibacterales bacterium]|nr:recombinase family protein [Vicinamibacterales bacterium]
MTENARRRWLDVLVCWRLDRLGRNLKHLITLLDELQALGVAFVSLAEGIDATTPAVKLQSTFSVQSRSLSGSASESGFWHAFSEPGRKESDWGDRRFGHQSNGFNASPGCRRISPPSGSASHGRRSSAGAPSGGAADSGRSPSVAEDTTTLRSAVGWRRLRTRS